MRSIEFILVFLIVGLSNISFSQTNELDSLKLSLDIVEDTKEKIDILTSLSFKLAGIEDGIAMNYANEGIKLAKETDYILGIAEGYRSLGQINRFKGKYETAREEYRKAKLLYDKTKNKKKISVIINDLGVINTLLGHLDKAFECFQDILQINKELKDTIGLAMAYSNIATVLERQGKDEEAIKYYKNVLILDSLTHQWEYFVESLGNIASAYRGNKQDDKALIYALRGYEFADSIGATRGICFNSSIIGGTYYNVGDYESALHYLKITVAAAKETGMSELIGNAYNELQQTYFKMDSIDLALSCLDSALLYVAPIYKHVIYNNIGILYERKLNNLDSAIINFERAIQAAKNISDSSKVVAPLIGKGLLLYKKGEPEKAIYFIEQGLSISSELNNLDLVSKQDVFKEIANVYYSFGDYQSSHKYLSKAVIFQDSLLTIEKKAQAKLLSYEKEIRQLQIKAQEQDIIEKERSLRDRLYLIFALGSIVFLISALGYIIFKNNQKLKSLNQKLKYLSNEIHHRVKNDFQSISSMIFVQQNQLKDGKVKQALLGVRDRILAMGQIHRLFYKEGNYFKMGLGSYLENLVKNRSDILANEYVKAEVDVNIDIDNKIERRITFDEAKQLGIVINELITNAYKYAFINHNSPSLTFNANIKDNKTFCIEVIDNGMGIKERRELNEDDGFGLNMIKTICEQLQWSIDYISSDKGTKFTINIPS